MIQEAVKIHNKTQFEIKLNYKFANKRKNAIYTLDTYIFLPNSLGVNKQTYRKVNFYDSIQNYIRFKTPVFTLEQIFTGKEPPITKLSSAYSNLVKNNDTESFSEFEFHTKLFTNIFGASLRDNTNFIINKIPHKDVIQIIRKQINDIHTITSNFRELKRTILVPTIKDEVFSIHRFADEFMSLLIEKYNFKILDALNKSDNSHFSEVKEELLSLIKKETKYRIEYEYFSISKENSDNEDFISRYSVLKKYLESALHIEANSEKDGKWFEQALLGFSAGLAMLFATAVAFFYQSIYGNLTTQLFIVLVISYVFKDRIKETLRDILSEKLLKNFYDYKIKLYLDAKAKIGKFYESFEFIRSKQIPKRILDIHHKYRTMEFYNKFSEEKVIRYRTKTALIPKAYKKALNNYSSEAITNILRFDVSRLLKKMDNPRKPIFTLTKDGYKKIYGRRSYNINLVIKYKSIEETIISHFRFVLSRNGIKRIESVSSEIY